MAQRDILVKILDLARWAPSGDNTQPWRFEILADDRIAIHGHDTREWCVYDFRGHASHMAHGALLETLRIAASGFGLRADWVIRPGCPDGAPIYDVGLLADPALPADPLLPFIEKRVVQRRPMKTTPLTVGQKEGLQAAVGPGYRLQFFEDFSQRWAVARLLWRNAHIRLTCPEAYRVHRDVIEWGARFSTDRIPEQALGSDPLTGKLMRWVMQSWDRVEFFNRYLMGTVAPRVQLDLLPALGCGAHVLICPQSPLSGLEAHVRLGVAMQRMWLTATAQGLCLQPEMTPVIFRWYARSGQSISAQGGIDPAAATLADAFQSLAGAGASDPFGFFCRVGISPEPRARSVRKSLQDLLGG
ncbi:MAG: molybdopterin biosynthesis protein MoeY [Rhodocyclaceae bacterium]|jgi:nitroreductase|nr:molybdopterin biosynthesis protein MoeY [Rhodocyclaceae bacterium]